MTSQIKFENAKKNLNIELEELENLLLKLSSIKDLKLEIAELESQLEDLAKDNQQKQNIIDNLQNEVNDLQKNMKEIGLESEFYREKNKLLADERQQKALENKEVLDEILNYVNQIEDLVKL